jgi:hypothetical protein
MSQAESGQASGEQAAVGADTSSSRVPGRKRWSAFGSSVTFLVFLGVFAWYSLWLGEKFLNTNPRLLDVHQNVPLLLISLGLTVCLISGQFDLSVGGMATLTTYLAVGLTILQEWPFWLVIITCVLVGIIGGSVNAFLVVKLRVNPFIATLGTGGILVGLSRVYSGGAQLAPTGDGPTLPDWFSGSGSFGSYQTKALPIITWVVVAFLFIVIAFVVSERVPTENRRIWYSVIAVNVVILFTVTVIFVETLARDMSYVVLFLLAVAFGLWVVMRYRRKRGGGGTRRRECETHEVGGVHHQFYAGCGRRRSARIDSGISLPGHCRWIPSSGLCRGLPRYSDSLDGAVPYLGHFGGRRLRHLGWAGPNCWRSQFHLD